MRKTVSLGVVALLLLASCSGSADIVIDTEFGPDVHAFTADGFCASGDIENISFNPDAGMEFSDRLVCDDGSGSIVTEVNGSSDGVGTWEIVGGSGDWVDASGSGDYVGDWDAGQGQYTGSISK